MAAPLTIAALRRSSPLKDGPGVGTGGDDEMDALTAKFGSSLNLSSCVEDRPMNASPESVPISAANEDALLTPEALECEFENQFEIISEECDERDTSVKPSRSVHIISAAMPRNHKAMFTSMRSLAFAKDDALAFAKDDLLAFAKDDALAFDKEQSSRSRSQRVKFFPLVEGHCLPQLSFEETPDLIMEDEIIPGLTRDFFEGNRERLLSELKDNSCVVLVSNGRKKISIDRYAPFRQHPSVTYFTGYLDVCIAVIYRLPTGAVEFSLFVEPRDPSKLTYTGDKAGCESAVRKFGALGAFALPPPPKPRPRASSQTEQTAKSSSTAAAAEQAASLEVPPKRSKPSDPFQTPSPYHNAATKVAANVPKIDPVKTEVVVSVPEDLLISPEFTTRSPAGDLSSQTESTRKDVKMFFSPPPPKKPAGGLPEKSPGSATRRSARLAAKTKSRAPAPQPADSPDFSLADTPTSTKAKRASSVPQNRHRNRGRRAAEAADADADAGVTKSKRKITFSPDTRAGRKGEASEPSSQTEASAPPDISAPLATSQPMPASLITETPSVSAGRMLRSARRAHLRSHVNTTGCTAKPPSPDPADLPASATVAAGEAKSSAPDGVQLVQSLESKFTALSLGASETSDPFKTPASAATASASATSLASMSAVRVLPDEYSDESSPLVCLLSNFENIYFDPVAEAEETSRSIRLSAIVIDALLTLDKDPLSVVREIDQLMFVKQPCEIELIRQAADLTARGYCKILETLGDDALQRQRFLSQPKAGSHSPASGTAQSSCSRSDLRSRFSLRRQKNSRGVQSLTEKRLQRVFEHYIEEEGASSQSYPLTVSSGRRNLRLAYTINRHTILPAIPPKPPLGGNLAELSHSSGKSAAAKLSTCISDVNSSAREALSSISPNVHATTDATAYVHDKDCDAEHQTKPFSDSAGGVSSELVEASPCTQSTLVLVDGGADWPPAFASHGGGGGGGCYASDVTRVFPAGNLKFSDEQRIVMKIVNECLDFVLDRLRPGAVLSRIENQCAKFAKERLAAEGIRVTLSTGAYSSLLVHDLAHPLGLLIHDCGTTMASIKDIPPLEPGVVLAVEPSIYLRDGQDGVPPRFQGIGVRVEDTVLILKDSVPTASQSPSASLHRSKSAKALQTSLPAGEVSTPAKPAKTKYARTTVKKSRKKDTVTPGFRWCEALSKRCPRTVDGIERYLQAHCAGASPRE